MSIAMRFAPALLAALLLASARAALAQPIGLLQGTSHKSPFADTRVEGIAGIVTAVEGNGFWMQDHGDGNRLTSDAIYVFRGGNLAKPAIGDAVLVTGQLQEFRPGGSDGVHNLTTTQIHAGSAFAFARVATVSSGHALPAPAVINNGFLPPTAIAPAIGRLDAAAGYTLDPSQYAIDFYESLEGMRVAIASAVAVGPRNAFGEIPVIASAQVGARGVITAPRGGVVVGPGQFNGHRIHLDDRLFAPTPAVHSGARLQQVVGVLDYGFGNFKLNLTQAVTVASNPPAAEVARIAPGRVGIASYNVLNLGGDATDARMQAVAGQIAHVLGAPHIIALQEVQDNDGTANSGTVASDRTLGRLAGALRNLTGRNYQFVAIDPVPNADGGQAGGNLRQAFLYDSTRVALPSRPIGGALDAIGAVAGPRGGVQLTFAGGRIDPGNAAFVNSRKPLAVEFSVDGHTVIVINNHFVSKRGDQPLFGAQQPPVLFSAAQRLGQARAVGRFVVRLLAIDPDANIVVTGDLNDFQFADTLAPLHAAGLVNLTDTLPEGERYTYNFEGNLQALDHMFVSPNLARRGALAYDIAHANAEFSGQVSDHDPVLLRFSLAPVAESGIPPLLWAGIAGMGVLGAVARRRRARAARTGSSRAVSP